MPTFKIAVIRFRCCTALTLLLLFTSLIFGQATWEVSPLSYDTITEKFTKIASGNNLFVALNDSGEILTSTDCKSWGKKVSITNQKINAISFGNDLFVAVGDSGTILTSPDGTNWTKQSSGINTSLNAIAFGDSMFVAGGDSLILLKSKECVKWDTIVPDSFPHDFKQHICGIAYGNGMFLAFLRSNEFAGNAYAYYYTSSDLKTWQYYQTFSSLYMSPTGTVFFINGKFHHVWRSGHDYVLSSISSDDGSKWDSDNNMYKQISAVTMCNGKYYAVDTAGYISSSLDGLKWQGWPHLNSLTFFNDRLVLAGDEGVILLSNPDSTWTQQSTGTTNNLNYITCINNQLVAVGNSGTILTSTDGVNWSKKNSGTLRNLRSVCFGNSVLIAVGDSGTLILSWPNANDWITLISGTVNNLNSVTYGNNKFVVAGNGWPLNSADGISWSPSTFTSFQKNYFGYYPEHLTPSFNSITFGDNEFLAVGNMYQESLISSSITGLDWADNFFDFHLHDIYARNFYRNVTFGSGQFVAVGPFIATSVVGSTAKAINNTPNLMCVTFGDNKFYAMNSRGKIYTLKPDNSIGIIPNKIDKEITGKVKYFLNNNHLSISLPFSLQNKKFNLTIFSVSGKKMYTSDAIVDSKSMIIPLSGLSKGAYIVTLKDGNKTIASSPFIVTK